LRTVIIIPARYQSSRFPGKPLALLKGATGKAKSLTRRVLEAAQAVPKIDAVYFATDDQRIVDEVEAADGRAVMTSENCRNGTERCAEAYAILDETADIVVNLQGDAPLTPPDFVTAMIQAMKADPTLPTATPGLRTDGRTLSRFQKDRAAGRVGGTTVVSRSNGDALYFSKEVIPHTAREYDPQEQTPVFHHVGLYAYRPSALAAYNASAPSVLEQLEGLEQLRFLDIGLPMRVVEVFDQGHDFWEVNNPVDVPRVEAALKARRVE
jgi:3-deoxy-manno-octulosonate cytidylyltransferase (CMP-KDO synthetase)